jgi:hypothetical protein
MTITREEITSDNYSLALIELGQIIIAVSQPVVTFYQQQSLPIKPETFISVYCRCLEFILRQKITGDKEHIQQLIIETIEKNTDQGNHLHQIVVSSHDSDNQVDKFSTENSEILVPVLKLSQFISNAIKLTDSSKLITQKDHNEIEALLQTPLQEVFELMFQASVQKISALQIANPLIFFLENFSTIVGWLAGFFAKLINQPIDSFLKKNIACLRTPL